MTRLGTWSTMLVLLTLVSSAVPVWAAPTAPVGAPQSGPDVPAVTMPVGVVNVFEAERFAFTSAVRTRLVTAPADHDRVVLIFREKPDGDPWDRTFGVAFGNVEVLHGTTPRTDMTVKKDVTAFASLLPPGVASPVSILVDSWVGAQLVWVTLEFYANEPSQFAVEAPADAALGALRWSGFCGNGQRKSVTMNFPETTPARALVELTSSGHGSQEFKAGVIFHVLVDAVEVAQLVTLPYTYAFLGFAGGNGQQNPTTLLIHQVMWWTGQQALDVVGVHTGVGEIPPYRANVLPEHLGLLSGTRNVEVVQQIGAGCVWITSVSVLAWNDLVPSPVH